MPDQVTNHVTQWGKTLAERAFAAGLAVTQPDGLQRPIPIGALPVILTDAEISRRAALAAHLVHATAKTASWRLAGSRRDTVLAALGPAERRLVQATEHAPSELAVARVDFLGQSDLFALEVNATIPAMQGYSDIASQSWLETMAAGRADLPDLIAANGSNAAALLDALVTIYSRARTEELSSIGLLCRRGDAQLSELNYLRNRFQATGRDAQIVHPDELVRRGEMLCVDGRPLQLIYRHVFLSRLDLAPAPDLEAAIVFRDRRGTLVLNRPAPHLEMKSTLAWLSRIAVSDELSDVVALTAAERDAVRSTVPWTRTLSLRDAPEAADAETHARIRRSPEAFVLKRSWSYGGHEVFVGRAHETDEFWARVHVSYPDIHRWADLVDRAASDARGGGYVVQLAVPRITSDQWLCTPDLVDRAAVVTDYAAYASIGALPAWSGVCRASAADIVNIVGGGAIVPIVREQVVERLWGPVPSAA